MAPPVAHLPLSFRGAPLAQIDEVVCRVRREPGIHNTDRGYGLRACAKRRIPE